MINQTRWPLVVIAAFAGFTAAFNIGKVSPVLPLIQAELGLDLSDLGWIVSAYSLLVMFLCLPMAIAGARFGNYRMALLALALMGGGGLISANADSFALLLTGRITEGFGFVMISVAGPALIARAVMPEDRPMGMTVWSTWLPVGVSTMLLLSPLLVALSGWRLGWSLTGWFALFWMLVLGVAFRQVGRAGDRQRGITKAEIGGIFQRSTVLLALSLTCFSMIYTVGIAFMPTIWQETKQVSLQNGSYLLALAMMGTLMGNIIGGTLVKRGYPINRILMASFIIPTCISSLVFVDALPFWFQYLCFFSFALCGGAAPAAVYAIAPAYTQAPVQISLMIALVFQGNALGQVLGPVLFSHLIEWGGHDWSWGVLFYGVFALLGGVVMYQVKMPKAY